jgi:hypothetical protein
MWNRSYRWQATVRLTAGVLVLLSVTIALAVLANTSAAHRTSEGARDLLSELLSPSRQTIEVQVPDDLQARVGTLVYRDREDGIAQVIGRVVGLRPDDHGRVTLDIRLGATSAAAAQHGGIVKGAPAALGLRDAVQLLVSPNTPPDEVKMARDIIWPSFETNVLPEIVDGLIREISTDLVNLDSEDSRLLARLIENLHQAIEPFENELVERLARRAWDTVGVQGLASGVLRAKVNDLLGNGSSVGGWWSWLTGDDKKSDAADRPFLSEQTSKELKTALEDEAVDFWKDNRAKIIEAFRTAIEKQREDFEVAIKDRWSAAIYEHVLLPAWQTGQDKVIQSINGYVSDFAERRLLTSQGGPRLLFAFVLRSYLEISSAPLLILTPAVGNQSDQFVYESLLR